jgi:hypothetical protein
MRRKLQDGHVYSAEIKLISRPSETEYLCSMGGFRTLSMPIAKAAEDGKGESPLFEGVTEPNHRVL